MADFQETPIVRSSAAASISAASAAEAASEIQTVVDKPAIVDKPSNFDNNEQPRIQVFIIDTHDFISALNSLNMQRAEIELEELLKVWPEYLRESDLICKFLQKLAINEQTNDPLMHALVIASQNKTADKTPSKTGFESNDPIAHYRNVMIQQVKTCIDWLIKKGFDNTNGASFLIKNMMQQKYICPADPSSPIKVDQVHYDKISEFSELFRSLCHNLDARKLDSDIKLMIKDCPSFVFSTLISCGLDVMEIIDGHELAWWIMRSAEHVIIQPSTKSSVGYSFVTLLGNCGGFVFRPRFFTGCSDMTVFQYISKNKDFIDGLREMIEPGVYFINTVTDDRIITHLINSGSPPQNQSIFHESLTNKIDIVRSLHSHDPSILTKFNSDDLNPFGYFCKFGDYTFQHFTCLKFIASHAPETVIDTVQDGDNLPPQLYFCWTPLHLACNRISIAAAVERNINPANRTSKTVESLNELPTKHFSMQEEIIEWLYQIYTTPDSAGKMPFKLDRYGRTPLMCMPIVSYSNLKSPELGAVKNIINKFVNYEIKGLKSLGYTISKYDYITFFQNWQIEEYKARILEHDLREMHANPGKLKKMAPWLKAN